MTWKTKDEKQKDKEKRNEILHRRWETIGGSLYGL
jgi:hypothetical protein